MTDGVLLEVCVDSLESALAAEQGGAQRLELCAELGVGGVTPSAGLLAAVLEHVSLPIVVLVRPRSGDFLYTRAEVQTIERDIHAAREAGAAGIALGALTADGEIDSACTARLVECAGPLQVTFHRAFDMLRDLPAGVDQIAELGIGRILTSGGHASVPEALPVLADLVRHAAERVSIMPGGGVRPGQAAEIVARTGVHELHASASGRRPSGMHHRNPQCSLTPTPPDESVQTFTDADVVRALREAIG